MVAVFATTETDPSTELSRWIPAAELAAAVRDLFAEVELFANFDISAANDAVAGGFAGLSEIDGARDRFRGERRSCA